MMNYATIIPLIGGMTLGNMLATGNRPKFLVSWDEFASNDEHLVNYLKDVPYYSLSNNENILSEWKGKLDFISTVCPCAGLSLLNNSTGKSARGGDAVQNDWMYRTANWVLENLSPTVFWGENAPGLSTHLGEDVRNKLRSIADSYGYKFSIMYTDTWYHGIPQHRIRSFYFFWKYDLPILNYVNIKSPTLKIFLDKIPDNSTYYNDYLKNEQLNSSAYLYLKEKYSLSKEQYRKKFRGALFHNIVYKDNLSEAIAWIQKRYPESSDLKELQNIQNKVKVGKRFWDSSPYFLLDSTNAIIGKNMHNLVHPIEDRFLSIRELMALMSMPNDFKILGNRWTQLTQNVPTLTAAHWTLEVIKYIYRNHNKSDYNYLLQNNIKQTIKESEIKHLFF